MQGEVKEEVLRIEDPEITVYSVEDDELYHERMGVVEHFREDDEGVGGTVKNLAHEGMEELKKLQAENGRLRAAFGS